MVTFSDFFWIKRTSCKDYLCDKQEIIINGIIAARISEAVESAHSVIQRIENPFMSPEL